MSSPFPSRLIPARAGKTEFFLAGRLGGPAHPRACGENRRPAVVQVGPDGSSPRVRGKLGQVVARVGQGRLIPARAGKTWSRPRARPKAPAHPRACGENSAAPSADCFSTGSSPRVRGKLVGVQNSVDGDGLIPARAGKTANFRGTMAEGMAHPRACGENPVTATLALPPPGSSPRVRGKLRMWASIDGNPGLIPARAGKTPRPTCRSPRRWAHPRACGENDRGIPACTRPYGSSPRVRGKRDLVRDLAGWSRLIPARAGKTHSVTKGPRWPAAHPRACGENRPASASALNRAGSSPRVRGKHAAPRVDHEVAGLIPARAGKTPRGRPAGARRRAHPRACGENLLTASLLASCAGSSPRVRGKRADAKVHSWRFGLIPARAGKTPGAAGPPRPGPAHPRACGENQLHDDAGHWQSGSSPRVRGKLGG